MNKYKYRSMCFYNTKGGGSEFYYVVNYVINYVIIFWVVIPFCMVGPWVRSTIGPGARPEDRASGSTAWSELPPSEKAQRTTGWPPENRGKNRVVS